LNAFIHKRFGGSAPEATACASHNRNTLLKLEVDLGDLLAEASSDAEPQNFRRAFVDSQRPRLAIQLLDPISLN
jgi:hypothetical protein